MKKMKSFQLLITFCSLLFCIVSCEKSQEVAEVPIATTALKAKTKILKNTNPGFEHDLDDWEVYEPNSIAQQAIVSIKKNEEEARFGQKYLFMSLPKTATDNQKQYISVGQSLALNCKKKYRFSAHVKWTNPDTEIPSAIISIWARNSDGSYNGKDEWIYDGNGYKYLNFEFTPNETGPVFCYIALLTHQEGFKTTDIYVDAFRVEEIGEADFDLDPRPLNQNLLVNGDFEKNFGSWQNTYSNPRNVTGLSKSIINEKANDNKKMRLTLPSASTTTLLNNTWTGVIQKVTLYAGNKYRLSAMVDRVEPDKKQYPTIVNLYTFKPRTTETSGPSWLGSVDYKFNRSDLHPYSQTIKPIETATYHITARVFGWGNDGNPVKVDLDDIVMERIAN